MDLTRVLGLIALVVGAILLGFGLSSTQAITEKVVEGVSGQYTNNTMLYIIFGAALLVGGLFTVLGCCKNKD